MNIEKKLEQGTMTYIVTSSITTSKGDWVDLHTIPAFAREVHRRYVCFLC